MPLPLTIAPNFHCPHCRAPNPITPTAANAYFASASWGCSECNKPVDWWDTVVATIENNFMYTHAFGFVGAQTTICTFELQPHRTSTVNFGDFGVPEDARVLAVNYTPAGPLFPLQWHSNQLIDGQRMWGSAGERHTINLWPASPRNQDSAETEVNCAITWVVSPPDEPSMSSLVDAFAAYATRRFSDAIIPANTAVEATTTKALNEYLSKLASRGRVEEFLNDQATYGSQLNVLLPVLARLNECPTIPETVRGQLNRLRKLRNDLAHSGCLENALSHAETARLLAGATLGIAYVRFFNQAVGN
jgi:hypothetical protein